MSKGILGVKKDPKKQILFSFGSRQGEEWPSDDSDSDYEPTKAEAEQEGLEIKRKPKKTKKLVKSLDGNAGSSRASTFSSPSSKNKSLWGLKIPPEILCMIFQHVVSMVGPLPFLCWASRVCTLWKHVAEQPSLWQNVDLSFGWIKQNERTLRWLCVNRLSGVKHLSLSMWKNVTDDQIQIVADHCRQLTSINLSYCAKVGRQGIQSLITNCPRLASLDLSFMHYKGQFQTLQSKAVSAQTLTYIVESMGNKLKSLNLSNNSLTGFLPVFNSLMENCPSLEVLDMNNCSLSNDFLGLNIEKLQSGCPKLRVIRLANTRLSSRGGSQKEQNESKGFPNLQELSLAVALNCPYSGSGIDDHFLHRLLKNAYKLKLLDLRGCSHLTSAGLQKLAATDLQALFISQSSIAKYNSIEIVIQKWQHSLEELDLSWNIYPGMSLDLAMRKLSDNPSRSKLEKLNLGGTSISCGRIQSLLEGCPNLKTLNLVSCRGLPRGMKREYSGEALDKLRDEIDSIVQREEGDSSR